MNQAPNTHKFTIAEAADHPQLGFIKLADIATDEATVTASGAKFMWLRELDADSDPDLLKAAEIDVREDGELFVMLNMPARKFYEWFKRDDWSIYETSLVLRDDVNWPFDVLERVKALIEAEGAGLAS